MLYKMQLIAYSPSGLLISSGDVILLGKFKSTPVQLMLNRLHFSKNDLSSMNLACGLLPTAIETNRYRVVMMVLDENLNPVTYAQMYEYKLN